MVLVQDKILLGDGLTTNSVYGTRVQDKEICLNVPDVIKSS